MDILLDYNCTGFERKSNGTLLPAQKSETPKNVLGFTVMRAAIRLAINSRDHHLRPPPTGNLEQLLNGTVHGI